MQSPFDEKQLKELDKSLDKRFISNAYLLLRANVF